jgi:hypothetical protein
VEPSVNRRTAVVAIAAGIAVFVLAGVTLWAWTTLRPRTEQDRIAAATASFDEIAATVSVRDSSLDATQAVADFGIEEGIRMVPVRIVEDLALEVGLETPRDVTLAAAPRLCLTGPFWNPLDAGLSDRCWGDPDLAELLAEAMPADADGRVTLRAGSPVVLQADLARGDERCDYPPGDWLLEVDAEPVVDGVTLPRQDIASVSLTVPLEESGPLPWRANSDTRFCSFTAAVYSRQGEPEITGR